MPRKKLLAKINAARRAARAEAFPKPRLRLLFAADIAVLLNLDISSVRYYGSHQSRHHLLPPFFKIGRRLAWRESVVFDWFLEREKEAEQIIKKEKGK